MALRSGIALSLLRRGFSSYRRGGDASSSRGRPSFRREKQPTRRQAAAPGELLCGLHVVQLALEARTRELHELVLDRERDGEGEFEALRKLARAEDVPVTLRSKERMNNMLSAGGGGNGRAPRHQGAVLRAGGLAFHEINSAPAFEDDLLPAMRSDAETDRAGTARAAAAAAAALAPRRARRVILALDEVVDPQNMGALLRTALFVGVTAVVASKRNCAPLTPAVSSSSAGALEVLAAEGRLACVRQLPVWLKSLRNLEHDGGIAGETPLLRPWRVLGADMGGVAVAADGSWETALAGEEAVSAHSDVVLVMGSEGSGLRATVRAACDALVAAPRATPPTGARHPSFALVDSLNVSVSAGILLDRLRGDR